MFDVNGDFHVLRLEEVGSRWLAAAYTHGARNGLVNFVWQLLPLSFGPEALNVVGMQTNLAT